MSGGEGRLLAVLVLHYDLPRPLRSIVVCEAVAPGGCQVLHAMLRTAVDRLPSLVSNSDPPSMCVRPHPCRRHACNNN